ncbi:Uma2 family endonuclease [Microcoleus sp. FACHB-1515]|uniref:Uma2 family endonuclease n=1 Tax=Cyanophyceae TaxID=3028117 RepID=UPI001686D0ED|nr:Uma2 family endonuclease [Microcoleus sp. FACHB-1515]MBD2091838.1 Uma2 family endonuclease [Microcoleus sp. FACHB-1515]
MTTQLTQFPKPKQARVIHDLTWQQLEEFDRSLEDVAGVKLVYLDGTLEIMTIGEEHEDAKATMRVLLENYLRVKGIRFYSRGGPTLGRKEQGARNEPDESFSIGTRGQYPDLVFEVTVTSGGVDRLEGYRRMSVTEVWFWEDGVLDIYHLRSNGYEKVSNTELVQNFPIDLFTRYITYHDQYDAVNEFLAAIQ